MDLPGEWLDDAGARPRACTPIAPAAAPPRETGGAQQTHSAQATAALLHGHSLVSLELMWAHYQVVFQLLTRRGNKATTRPLHVPSDRSRGPP